MTNDQKIRAYIGSLPGPVRGLSPVDIFEKVRQASGAHVSLTEIKDSMFRCGYSPGMVGGRWMVALPSGPYKGIEQ